MKIIQECKIGSAAWFCGVFWLCLACIALYASKATFILHLDRLTWVLVGWTMKANKMALTCALEGGAEVEEDE